jgi:hypothetical protein
MTVEPPTGILQMSIPTPKKLLGNGNTTWVIALSNKPSNSLPPRFAKTGKRKEIFLATKFGFSSISNGSGKLIDTSPEYLRGAIERSLKRLQTGSHY